MTDTNDHGGRLGDEAAEGPAGPHRVIGTPPPAEARILLGQAAADVAETPSRDLPADPPDLGKAKIAERIVATCFIIAMLAGIGFIAAYIGLPVHSLDAVLRSNLALGTALSVAFLGLAFGATIWVRNLMPAVARRRASSSSGRCCAAPSSRPRCRSPSRPSCCSATWARCRAPACGTPCGARAPGCSSM